MNCNQKELQLVKVEKTVRLKNILTKTTFINWTVF